jgi:2,3-bisphosphoglycerate-dependent phosphoglycerate mutase
MTKIILVRHGQSLWNAENRFTGWVDSDLSEKGKAEAKLAGLLIKKLNISISTAYTSYLKRAQNTLNIILDILGNSETKIEEAWEFNERHYGSLTGLNKTDTMLKLGKEKLKEYRRSWDISPPPIGKDSKFLNEFSKLNSKIPYERIPKTESLEDTYYRVLGYYKNKIVPEIEKGKNIIIVAHGNSLRAFCKFLFNISNEKINSLEIPTGNPMCVTLERSTANLLDVNYLDQNRKEPIIINK